MRTWGALILALAATPACAQPMGSAQLLEALKQRDTAIAALEKRIEALERERAAAPAPQAPPVPIQTVAAPAARETLEVQEREAQPAAHQDRVRPAQHAQRRLPLRHRRPKLVGHQRGDGRGPAAQIPVLAHHATVAQLEQALDVAHGARRPGDEDGERQHRDGREGAPPQRVPEHDVALSARARNRAPWPGSGSAGS
jgi:hypothetical protein